MTTGLIFRIDPGDITSSTLTLQVPAFLEDIGIAAERVGEDVVFGHSDVPGIWMAHACGRFDDWTQQEDGILLRFSDVRSLPDPVTIVTEGDPESDWQFRPYLVDTLFAQDMARLRRPVFEQSSVTPMATAAEDQPSFRAGRIVGGLQFAVQDETFFHNVAAAYSWRCAISRVRQSSIDGLAQEGVVIGVEEPYARDSGAENQGLFLSGSFAFAYRHGLIAIGDEYELLRHVELDARMRMFLEISNPTALLHKPDSPEHWPSLEAIRRHRRKFGY